MSINFDGRVAIVTGAGGGLGREHALALAKRGAKVVVNDLGPGAEAVAQEIKAAGGEALAVLSSVTDFEAVQTMVKQAMDTWGRVDILVNNAGIIRRRAASEHTDEDWDAVIAVNLSSVFRLCRAAGRHMIERRSGGKIVNIASMLSFQGGITVPGYAASKGGLVQLTKALANEWAASGINVNAIAPGYMETDNTTALRADAARNREITARIPAGRWGTPDDLGGAVVFLCSRASDYIHGHVLAVDGGWLAR
jgi:2-deoxy-D-gluconate 3-dehydrogenase